MLYAARDGKGGICELHPMPTGTANEALPADHPEVLQFIHERWRQNELHELDRDFVRVIEDTIELLIAKDLMAGKPMDSLPSNPEGMKFVAAGPNSAGTT